MKRKLALILAILMAAAFMAACAEKPAETSPSPSPAAETSPSQAPPSVAPSTAPSQPPPSETPPEESQPPETPDPGTTEPEDRPAYLDIDGSVLRIIIFENGLENVEESDQPFGSDTRQGYSWGAFAENNFWFSPADEVAITSYADGYTATEITSEFFQKYLALTGDSAPIVIGATQDKNWAIWQVGYVNFGYEAACIMGDRDELSILDLFEAVGMAVADSYDFICTDGYTHNVAAADLAECSIKRIGERIDGIVPGIGSYTLMDVVNIQVADLEMPQAQVMRITVFENALSGLAATEQPFGSDMRSGYSVSEFVAANFILPPEEEVTIVAMDGYTATELYAVFSEKYVCLEGSDAPIMIGASQDKNWAVWNMAHISFGWEAVCFVPEEGVSVAELFEAVGMVAAPSYNFICTDGYTHNIEADLISACYIRYVDGRIDGIVPGIGDYTLMELLNIVPADY